VIAVALGVHAGSGVVVVSDNGAELGDRGEVGADADDDGDGTAVHGCGALTHVAGNRDAGSTAVLGKAGC
jgi:hypothetical protein